MGGPFCPQTAFGRAFGALPEKPDETTAEQKEFIKQAVAGFAEEGKVVCVRLALFAEMLKGKSWVPGVLKQVGGVEGVGTTFLEETFSASTSPPKHRYHQKAARAVLKAILPESGTNIRGHVRCYGDLLEASGYASRGQDFNDLVTILDSELRLITPTDPEGTLVEHSELPVRAGQKHYQLTHDYLIPSLREWLTYKQKETMRGRAELRLAELAELWSRRHGKRYYPSAYEYVVIRLLTNPKHWTDTQWSLMRHARARNRLVILFIGLLVLTLLAGSVSIVTSEWRRRDAMNVLEDVRLLEADNRSARKEIDVLLEQVRVLKHRVAQDESEGARSPKAP